VRTLLSRIAGTFRRRRLEEEFDEEVREHIGLLERRYIRQGMAPEEAHYAARRQFGGVTQMKEELRDRRALPFFDLLARDARHAFRQLRKSKGFTATAALTLALGIGSSTAVFAVLNAVVLRPLPFAQPGRLMAFRPMDRRGAPHRTVLSYPNFFDYRRENRVFERLVCYRADRYTLTDSLPAIQAPGQVVSWDLFPLLGVQPALGRGFRPEEERAGSLVVVLSDRLWRSRFGADPAILGRRVRINGGLYSVVGVAPAGFHFPVDDPSVDLWTTLADDSGPSNATPLTAQRGARVLFAIGRLKPGVTVERARAQMDQVAAALAQQYPDEDKYLTATWIVPELESLTGSSRRSLWILLGAVGLVVLIACANVANLLLVRSTERAREFTVRAAMGASRPALVRQLLIESLALGLVASAGGVALALGILKAILPLAGESLPRIAETGIDAQVLAFAALLTTATCVLFSVAPAFQVARTDLASAIKGSAANIARGHNRFRSALITGQIALGLLLLMGAELLIVSFVQLSHRDPGFRADHLLTFDFALPDTASKAPQQIAFCDRLLEGMRTIPGVRAAAMGGPLPLEGDQLSVGFNVEERPAASLSDWPSTNIAIVTPGYFRTIGIPLLQGRDFTEKDDAKAPRVLIVNEAFARKFFPGERAIGKRIEPGANDGQTPQGMREIVGVVGNARQFALDADPAPVYYAPSKQFFWGNGTIVLHTAVPPASLVAAARTALVHLDAHAPMFRVRTGEERAAAAIARPKFQMALMAAFAAVALLLTMSGLYGVLSYSVSRRLREIGVRIALGAGRRAVLGLVLREAMRMVALGLALGLAGATIVRRLVEGIVFGIRPGDPLFLAAACVTMALTSLAAAYVPAARAASVDPMRTLRTE
jgi:predicted permease